MIINTFYWYSQSLTKNKSYISWYLERTLRSKTLVLNRLKNCHPLKSKPFLSVFLWKIRNRENEKRGHKVNWKLQKIVID